MSKCESESTSLARSAGSVSFPGDRPWKDQLHELRQPVATLGLLNQALLDATDVFTRRELQQRMAQAIAELNRLLDQGQQALQPMPPEADTPRSAAPALLSTGGPTTEAIFTNLAGIRVMVIDDHDTVRHSLRTLLELQQADVHEFGDPRSAALWLQSTPNPPDAALIDQQLNHEVDGVQLVAELRALRPGLAVLLTTADSGPDLARRAANAGIEVMLKPVRPQGISAWLRRTVAVAQRPGPTHA